MLCEDKDTLRDEYALWHGSAAEFAALDPAAVRGKRVTPYGAEALVRREDVPQGSSLTPVSIEELFVMMVKRGGSAMKGLLYIGSLPGKAELPLYRGGSADHDGDLGVCNEKRQLVHGALCRDADRHHPHVPADAGHHQRVERLSAHPAPRRSRSWAANIWWACAWRA